MERGLVKTSDGYIHYRATGEGPPIILLHATPKSSALYLELMEVLGSKLRVVALDTLGYGMSDHPDYPPTIQDYARVVTEVLKSLGIRRASFLGASTGGFIAVELATATQTWLRRSSCLIARTISQMRSFNKSPWPQQPPWVVLLLRRYRLPSGANHAGSLEKDLSTAQ